MTIATTTSARRKTGSMAIAGAAARQAAAIKKSAVKVAKLGKAASVKKPAATAGSRVDKGAAVTPEQRYCMIAEAAYYIAERRGFCDGDLLQDWIEAESQIDRMLCR